MTKPTSCGVLIINERDEILVGESTGNNKYDLPKGQKEDDERYVDAAIRELKEETGLGLDECQLNFVGRFPKYSAYKELVLYAAYVHSSEIDIDSLVCESKFTSHNGEVLPELCGFMWMPWCQYKDHMFKNMQKVFEEVFEELTPTIKFSKENAHDYSQHTE